MPPEATSLFIVGHGTELNDNSAKAAKDQAAKIRALGSYAQVHLSLHGRAATDF